MKPILDPDADGKQWLYSYAVIQDQSQFPELLKYCAFENDAFEQHIGVDATMKGIKAKIDAHFKNKK
jgi:hypothetical protein